MFKLIDFASSDGMVRQAFLKLIRVIQTELEHKRVDNQSGTDMVKGDVVYCSGSDREMTLAAR